MRGCQGSRPGATITAGVVNRKILHQLHHSGLFRSCIVIHSPLDTFFGQEYGNSPIDRKVERRLHSGETVRFYVPRVIVLTHSCPSAETRRVSHAPTSPAVDISFTPSTRRSPACPSRRNTASELTKGAGPIIPVCYMVKLRSAKSVAPVSRSEQDASLHGRSSHRRCAVFRSGYT